MKIAINARRVIAVAAMLAVGTANADSVAAARGLIASNSISRNVDCRYYKALLIDGCDKSELDTILQRNIEGHKRWKALAGSDFVSPQTDLGKAYAALGMWKEAKAELVPVLESLAAGTYMDAIRVSEANWEMANILWQEGDKEGAKKYLANAAAIHRTGKLDDFLFVTGRAKYLLSMFADPDGDIDMLKLPHSTDCKPFPTPQDAKYGEKKVSLAKVEVKFRTSGTDGTDRPRPASLASPVSPEDPIVRLLKKKLARFGSKFEKGGTKVSIEISPDAPVDKPQGYLLEVKSQKEEGRSGEYGVVSIKSRDRLGATWGVVSFLQCVQRKEQLGDNSKLLPSSFSLLPSIRTLRIEDWPKCQERGVTPYWEPEFLEYALFYKMKVVAFTMNRQYRLSPLDKELFRIVASRFADFGVRMSVGTDSLDVRPLPPFSSPRTWDIHLKWYRFLASIGVGGSIVLDDDRFPMHPKDIEAAGTAANLDAKFVTRLYHEVKKDYPNFTMGFCPPFYWGPYGRATYPEPRDEYLKSLARDLDPEIGVAWTGPYVKTCWMNEKTVGWITNLIGRKPRACSNGNAIGQHNHYQFGADLTGYKESHATNLFDMVSAFLQNMSRYAEACEVGSCMDWCWNPEAHDAKTAVRRAVEQVEGPGVFEALAEGLPALSYFDKYVYGRPRVEVLTEDQADLDRKVAAGEAAWEKAMSFAKNGGLFVEGFKNGGIKWAKGIAEARRNPPAEFKAEYEAIMANTAFAKKEVAYDESKGDEFIPAEIMGGGKLNPTMSSWSPGGDRAVKYVSPGDELVGRFTCDMFPPERPFKMLIVGMSFIDDLPTVEVSVNGNVIWSGVAYQRYYFLPKEIEIPVVAIKRNNTFSIKCISQPGTRIKALIHYVVIKK